MMNKLKCNCGHILSCKAGDVIHDGSYRWFMSICCSNCGNATEMDGQGIESIPIEVQQIIVERDGDWEICAENHISKIIYVLKKFSEKYNIPIIVENTNVVFRGTKNQAIWIKDRLIERGIAELDLKIRIFNYN